MSARDAAAYGACDFAASRNDIAAQVVARQFADDIDLARRYGPAGREKCEQDARYHLLYLAEAVSVESFTLFDHYIAWLHSLLLSLSIPSGDLARQLELLASVLEERAVSEHYTRGADYLRRAAGGLEDLTEQHSTSFIAGPRAELLEQLLDALLACRRDRALELVDAAVAGGISVKSLYMDVFQPLLREVGRLWQLNRVTVAQEHYCTAAIQLLMGQLSVRVFGTDRIGHSMLTACVGDELHEVGARMVCDFFEMSGWDTRFLGANVPTSALLAMLLEAEAEVLCLSVTLASHLSAARDIIATIERHEPLAQIKVIVGGMPFNVQPNLWQRIGAHGCAHDAPGAVELAARLVGH